MPPECIMPQCITGKHNKLGLLIFGEPFGKQHTTMCMIISFLHGQHKLFLALVESLNFGLTCSQSLFEQGKLNNNCYIKRY